MSFHPIKEHYSNKIEAKILEKLIALEGKCSDEQFKSILVFVIREIESARAENYLLGIDLIAEEICNLPPAIAKNIRDYAEIKVKEIEVIESDDLLVLCDTIKTKLKDITDRSHDIEFPLSYHRLWDEDVFLKLYSKLDTFIKEL